jgi:CRP/FNR family cyclic AMP-dependent transcriptional regulator
LDCPIALDLTAKKLAIHHMRLESMSPFFARLGPSLQARLVAEGEVRRYGAGRLLHQAGDMDPKLSIVRGGRVRFFSSDRRGQEITIDILEPGETFGELTVLRSMPRQLSAEAIGEVVVAEIGPRAFRRLMDQDAELRQAVLENMALTLSLAAELVDDERRLPLIARLAKALVALGARHSADGRRVPMSQSALADYLGVSRVSIGTALAELAERGWIATGYREVTLIAPDALRARGVGEA